MSNDWNASKARILNFFDASTAAFDSIITSRHFIFYYLFSSNFLCGLSFTSSGLRKIFLKDAVWRFLLCSENLLEILEQHLLFSTYSNWREYFISVDLL